MVGLIIILTYLPAQVKTILAFSCFIKKTDL